MSIGYLFVGMISALLCATLSLAMGGSAPVAFAVYVITGQLVLLALLSMAVVHTTRERDHAPL
ncbi:hypothetical protein [uncultured Sulfitobacter sp.]|uniref:hypothetical protein n=1 Tax=uncultured Sulfitobacter sp. TaxID=191468 RepID=UPI002634CE63|nr:hypothetical protein [uncultured Sulfitobacter sp.]